MDPWKIESNSVKQSAFTWAIVVVGLVLMYGFRDFDGSGFTDSLAGFLLGVLLLIVGVPGILMVGKETISVDPNARQISIEHASRFGKKNRIIPFNDIIDVHVSSLGNRSEGSVSYYVTLKLSSGKNFPLFFPAYYDGRWDRSIAEGRCSRLEEYLGRPVGGGSDFLG